MKDNAEEFSHIPVKVSINLLKKTVPYEEVMKIGQKSDIEGLKQTLFHSCCILMSGYLLHTSFNLPNTLFGITLRTASMLLHSFFLSFLFMPLHECTHKTCFKSEWANKMLAWICGFLTWRPPIYYQVYHYPHHRYTGDTKNDPELLDSLLDIKMTSLSVYLLYISGFLFWSDRTITTCKLLVGYSDEPWVKLEKNKKAIIWETRYIIALYLSIAILSYIYNNSFAWYYWVLPSLIGQSFLRFYLIAEHNGCQNGPNMMMNTRTVYTWWFYRKLAWNMPYHAEHHAFPSVPFHALEKVHMLAKNAADASNEQFGCNPSGKDGYFAVNKGLVDSIRKTNRNK